MGAKRKFSRPIPRGAQGLVMFAPFMTAGRIIGLGVLLFSLYVGSVGTALAELASSPWPMFQGGLQHTGRSPYVGPGSPFLKWSFHLDGTPGSPAIGPDRTIYLPTGALNTDTKGYLYAINPDGSQRWRYQFAGLPASTAPAIASDGTIYVHVNGDESNIVAIEKLYALNPDGSLKWVFKPNLDLGSYTSDIQSSPAIAPDGTIYVGSMNTFLFAVNPDGTLKWAVSPSSSSIVCSPVIGLDGTIYLADAGFDLWAYNPDGTFKWKAELSDASGGEGSASIGSDGTIYVATSGNMKVHAISPDGAVKWSKTLGFEPLATPAIAVDGTVYINADSLYAFSPSGTLKWKYGSALFSQGLPVVGGDGTIYWGDGDKLNAVDPKGKARWGLAVPRSPTVGLDPSPAIAADGTLYLAQRNADDASKQYLRAYGAARRPSLSRPVTPARVLRGRYFTTYGYVAPRVAGKTRLYFYRRVGGRWVRYRWVGVVNHYVSSARSKYSLRYRLPYRGSWYARAYFPGTSGILAGWSIARFFSVR